MAERTQVPLPVRIPDGPHTYEPFTGDVSKVCKVLGVDEMDRFVGDSQCTWGDVLRHLIGEFKARYEGCLRSLNSIPSPRSLNPRTLKNLLTRALRTVDACLNGRTVDLKTAQELEPTGLAFRNALQTCLDGLNADTKTKQPRESAKTKSLKQLMPRLREFFDKYANVAAPIGEQEYLKHRRKFAALVMEYAGIEGAPDAMKSRKQFDAYLDEPFPFE